jgi:hypothetical protein
MKQTAVALLWRVVLLLVAADVIYNEGYDHGVRDTEFFYEGEDYSADPHGTTTT